MFRSSRRSAEQYGKQNPLYDEAREPARCCTEACGGRRHIVLVALVFRRQAGTGEDARDADCRCCARTGVCGAEKTCDYPIVVPAATASPIPSATRRLPRQPRPSLPPRAMAYSYLWQWGRAPASSRAWERASRIALECPEMVVLPSGELYDGIAGKRGAALRQ